MRYKVDIEDKLTDTKMEYLNRYPDKNVNIADGKSIDNSYSKEDELYIIKMINNGFDYGLYDKVWRMKIE